MAEFLVKDKIEPEKILSIYTADRDSEKDLKRIVSELNIKNLQVSFDKVKFFLPNRMAKFSDNITLVEGDMIFTSAKILTISVNTVGVMGKGLASRARYQFPDVYVEYQNLCRSKKLKMGRPCLIKREKSVDDVLAYDSDTLENKNNNKWFLLFPTKTHWKEDSDFEGIKKGLEFVLEMHKKESFESIAMPALGCGLGNLSWEKVKSLMCQYLDRLNIPVYIYLPIK